MKIFGFDTANLFKRSDAGLLTSTGERPISSGMLFDTQAMDQLLLMLTRLPDPDDTLRSLGMPRSKLRVLMSDDEVYQAFSTRRDAVLSVPMRLEPGPEEDVNAKFLVEQLAPHAKMAVEGAWNAVPYGYSVLEVVYSDLGSRIGIQSILEKPFEWFEPKNTGELWYYANTGALPVPVDTNFKFFLTRSHASFLNPYGEALLSRLYWAWFFRFNGWKFWSKFLERFGTPLLLGKSESPSDMLPALIQAHAQSSIAIGTDDDVSIVESTATAGGASFSAFEEASVRRIQKIVLGQTLTSGTDGGSGNRALGQVHDAVRSDKKEADLSMITETLQRVVDALATLNRFNQKYVVFFSAEAGLEVQRADRDLKLSQTKQIRFTKQYLMNNYDFREGDIEIVEAQPVPPELAGTGNNAAPVPNQPNQDNTNPPGKEIKPTTASRVRALFAKDNQFTPDQQELEDLADAAIQDAGQPIDPAILKAAVLAAKNPEDLEQRLYALVGKQLGESAFTKALESALFVADVLGYANSEKE